MAFSCTTTSLGPCCVEISSRSGRLIADPGIGTHDTVVVSSKDFESLLVTLQIVLQAEQ
jgi:hypothetical protein